MNGHAPQIVAVMLVVAAFAAVARGRGADGLAFVLDVSAGYGAVSGSLQTVGKYGHRETVMLLLSLGADRDAIDRHGRTPREIATLAGNHDVAKLL